jgi:hypothetical protein
VGKIHIAVLKNDIEQVKLLVEKGGYFFWETEYIAEKMTLLWIVQCVMVALKL